MGQRYLIALGSNMRHHRHGRPAAVLQAALAALGKHGVKVQRVGPTLHSRPLGPSQRQYANSAAVVKTKRDPDELLDTLKALERSFGRRSGGQRWGSRVLDLDIVLWQHGAWSSPSLTVPHLAFRTRDFVLRPAVSIAPAWRDPLTGLTLRQLHSRLTRRAALPKRG